MNWIINIAKLFADFTKLKKISKLLKTSPRKLWETFVNTPEEFANKLSKIPKQARKEFSEAVEKATKKQTETQTLSSSWIKKGTWTPVGLGVSGDLTIWTVKGKHGYTYPGVDYAVWTAMKKAKGRNGGGAGSVFWAMYLRQFKSSTFGQFLKRMQKLTGVKGFK